MFKIDFHYFTRSVVRRDTLMNNSDNVDHFCVRHEIKVWKFQPTVMRMTFLYFSKTNAALSARCIMHVGTFYFTRWNFHIDNSRLKQSKTIISRGLQWFYFSLFHLLLSVLHLGNVYFHRKQLKHGQEGVEIGSDAEIRWTGHLLRLDVDGIKDALTTKTTVSAFGFRTNRITIIIVLGFG